MSILKLLCLLRETDSSDGRNQKPAKYLHVITRTAGMNETRLWSSKWHKFDMHSKWRKKLRRVPRGRRCILRLEIEEGCLLLSHLLSSLNGGQFRI